MTSTSFAHPRPNPTPPRGIRQVEYVGRHRLREPEPQQLPRWKRAVRALAIVEKPETR